MPNDELGDFDIGTIVRTQYNPIIRAIRELEKPVVCAVNGVAAGAGANLAFACDIVIAAREANFIQAFCKIGLIPDSSGTFFLPRLAGFARASGMALLGDKVSAEQARDWGLIWQVVDGADLMQRSRELARHLATQPTREVGPDQARAQCVAEQRPDCSTRRGRGLPARSWSHERFRRGGARVSGQARAGV